MLRCLYVARRDGSGVLFKDVQPSNWGPPWDGYYSYVPLPGLRDGQDYVAKLGEACSVPTEALAGQRIACLNRDGLEALFHRLAMNSLRFPKTPTH